MFFSENDGAGAKNYNEPSVRRGDRWMIAEAVHDTWPCARYGRWLGCRGGAR